jgi:hypothetical protein
MKEQNYFANRNVNLAIKKGNLEDLINNETRKLVGYIMPILEGQNVSENQRLSIKKILYTYKNNLCSMLINEMSNEKQNQ